MRFSFQSSVTLYLTISSWLFISMLFLSAYLDRNIFMLHLFEAIPFALVPWLSRRKPKIGYLSGIGFGVLWIWMAGFLTTFIKNGFERIPQLVVTGSVDRPDILLAVPAFIGTFGLSLTSLFGYWQLSKKHPKDLILFLGIILLAFLFFIVIFAAFAPHYLGMFRNIIGD